MLHGSRFNVYICNSSFSLEAVDNEDTTGCCLWLSKQRRDASVQRVFDGGGEGRCKLELMLPTSVELSSADS